MNDIFRTETAGNPDRGQGVSWRLFLGCAAVALAARLLFWAATDWTIEDGLIIARIVRNFVEGHGLVFNEGTRASTATSPLFAWAAALLACAGLSPIAAAKILGAIAGAVTAGVMALWLRRESSSAPAFAGALVFALFPPAVAYSVGGMETAVYTLACFAALIQITKRASRSALAWGAVSVLLRPDGLIALAVVSFFALRDLRNPEDRRKVISGMALAGAMIVLGAAAHRLYYGAWVPQTMIAKSVAYEIWPGRNTLRYLHRMFLSQPYGLPLYVLAGIGLFRTRRWKRWAPLLVWYIVYHLAFFLRARFFSWYLQPPLAVLTAFAGAAVADFLDILGRRRPSLRRWVPAAAAVAILVAGLAACAWYARGRRLYQLREETVRMAAGCWLDAHADPSERVFTESLGYIGYYCRNPIVDWPGLAEPGVIDLLRRRRLRGRRLDGYLAVIREFQPRWLVLRVWEWNELEPSLAERYEPKIGFPASGDVEYRVCGLRDAPPEVRRSGPRRRRRTPRRSSRGAPGLVPLRNRGEAEARRRDLSRSPLCPQVILRGLKGSAERDRPPTFFLAHPK